MQIHPKSPLPRDEKVRRGLCEGRMGNHTVTAKELAIKALRYPEDRARVAYHVDGRGNDGLKIYVERTGTKTWYYRARVAGSATKTCRSAAGRT